MRSVGRSPRAGRIESTEPIGIERDRWASREAEVSGSERVNSFASAGPDAIRGSRIISQNGFRDHSLITFGVRGSQPVRFREDCEHGVSGIISLKARQP